jgi:hypothetical protein
MLRLLILLLLPQEVANPQLPSDISEIAISPASCVAASSYADVLDAQTKRSYKKITVTAVGTVKYKDEKRPPFVVTVSVHEAEVTADNVREETMALGAKDCVRWAMFFSHAIEEYYKEHPKKGKK